MERMMDVTRLYPEDDPFKKSNGSIWILGNNYDSSKNLSSCYRDIENKLWMTYRKEFPEIETSGINSDKGWGCMLRCGQMVLAEALQREAFGRNWNTMTVEMEQNYLKILKYFFDDKDSRYSIHSIAREGESLSRPIGSWFGPNTIAQALKKLTNESDSHVVYIALDNTVIIEEIKEISTSTNGKWKSLILFIPLRLGLSSLNPIYISDLKDTFEFPQSLGVIGGRPNHALYFIGYVEDDLIYLDPHVITQTSVKVTKVRSPEDQTYHTRKSSSMKFESLDPSLSLCFYCGSEKEFDDLTQRFLFKLIRGHNSPFFELCRERPQHFKDSKKTYTLDEKSSDSDFEIL